MRNNEHPTKRLNILKSLALKRKLSDNNEFTNLFLPLKLSGQKQKALLDTGASNSVIRKSLAQNLIKQGKAKKIKVKSSNPISACGHTINLCDAIKLTVRIPLSC